MRAVAAAIAAFTLVLVGALPGGAAPTWIVVPDASTPPTTELTGVACVTTTRCFAVGYRQTTNDFQSVIEQGIGRTWKRLNRPAPGGRRAASSPPLTSIVCGAPGNCFAVGSYTTTAGKTQALIYRWNGSAWGIMKAEAPVIATTPKVQRSAQTSLNSVACPTPKSCYAVGYYEGTKGSIKTLVEHWNGKTWLAQPAPTAAKSPATVLRGVSCVSDTRCYAVGTAASGTHSRPFIVRWNGKVWSVLAGPVVQFGALDGIACASTNVCFAVGSVPSTTTSTLLTRWNGTKWTVVPLKNMPTANHLFGIACPTTKSCIAVGRKTWTTAGFSPLSLHWDGTTWTEIDPPNQENATSNWLNAVACASATQCRAVGAYLDDGTYHSFIQNYG